jgi:hypothetical protein
MSIPMLAAYLLTATLIGYGFGRADNRKGRWFRLRFGRRVRRKS